MQSYARSFPHIFKRAVGTELFDVHGRRHLDFLAGAGSLNYGHNNPLLKAALIAYIEEDGITHSLDLHTVAKERFLEAMQEIVLEPRGLDYVIQFTGPTGTNAVEAALKIARKATGRTNVVCFTNGFHGVSLGALAVTGNEYFRRAAGVPLQSATAMPYDGYLGDGVDTLDHLERMLADRSSGMELPAAVILEAVQGEGGLNVASTQLAAAPAGPVQRARDRADRRRHPGRLRPHRHLLLFRAGGPEARHRHAVEVAVGLRPAVLGRAHQARARRVEARRAQRHLPRQQPRLRHRHGDARALLAHAGLRRERAGEGPASARRGCRRWSTASRPTSSTCAGAA